MGSFNTTCAITKTPILEGQEVRVFFLVIDQFGEDYSLRATGLRTSILAGPQCYPWDVCQVIGYPLKGVYADYNQYEFDDDSGLVEATLAVINRHYEPNRPSSDKRGYERDHMDIEKIESMRQLQDMEHDGAVRLGRSKGMLAKMAIHEEVYQHIIAEGLIHESWEDKAGLNYSQSVDKLLSQFTTSNISPENQELLTKFLTRLKESGESQEKVDEMEVAMRRTYLRENECLIRNTDWIKTPFKQLIGRCNDVPATRDLCDSLIGGYMVVGWMRRNNYQLLPAVLSGQSYDFKASAKTMRELADIVEQLEPEWD